MTFPIRRSDPGRPERPTSTRTTISVLAVPLCFGLVLWMQLFHASLGATEHNEPPLILHWLRDSILALPLVFAGVWAGLASAARIRLGLGRARRRSEGLRNVVAVAVTTSFALSLGSPVHGWLFGAGEGHHHHLGGAALSPPVHIARDALVALPVSLLLTALVVWFLFGERPLRRRTLHQPASSVLTTGGSLVYDNGMLLTRGDLVKLGVAGGVTLFLPFKDISTAAASEIRPSPKFPPFQQALRIPPMLKHSPGATSDHHTITMRQETARCLPDVPGPSASQETLVWCYESAYPGPTIVAQPGVPVAVTYENHLHAFERSGKDVEAVIHLHGGHHRPEMDGLPRDFPGDPARGFNPFKSVIRPGESLTYTYPNAFAGKNEVPKSLWYHDHIDGFTGEHVYMGLAGCYCIDDPDSPPPQGSLGLPAGDFDVPLLLQDRLFDANNQFVYPVDPHEPDDGVLGDTFLVNGVAQPFFNVQRRSYRFRIYNGSNRRWYNLGLSTGQPLVQIATEAGFIRNPVPRTTILIAPAERVEVVVNFKDSPGTVYLTTFGMDLPEAAVTVPLVRFDVSATSVPDKTMKLDSTTVLRTFDDFPPQATPIVKRFFVFDDSDGWAINDKHFNDFFNPIRPIATPKLDTTEIWTFQNDGGDWVHPIHVHDVPQRVLSRGESQRLPPLWERGSLTGAGTFAEKDTVPLGPDQRATVALHFVDYTGPYVFHCHNVEHEDMAMMALFEVVKS